MPCRCFGSPRRRRKRSSRTAQVCCKFSKSGAICTYNLEPLGRNFAKNLVHTSANIRCVIFTSFSVAESLEERRAVLANFLLGLGFGGFVEDIWLSDITFCTSNKVFKWTKPSVVSNWGVRRENLTYSCRITMSWWGPNFQRMASPKTIITTNALWGAIV